MQDQLTEIKMNQRPVPVQEPLPPISGGMPAPGTQPAPSAPPPFQGGLDAQPVSVPEPKKKKTRFIPQMIDFEACDQRKLLLYLSRKPKVKHRKPKIPEGVDTLTEKLQKELDDQIHLSRPVTKFDLEPSEHDKKKLVMIQMVEELEEAAEFLKGTKKKQIEKRIKKNKR